MEWTQAGLAAAGFQGFVTLADLDESSAPPELAEAWVPGACVLYLGKTGGPKGLSRRLGRFANRKLGHAAAGITNSPPSS